MYPSRLSHCWSRLSCVDLPDPSMPSTMKSLPGNWWSPYIRIEEKYKQTTRLLQTVMSGQLGLKLLILALLMIAATPAPAGNTLEPPASVATDDAKPDYAPIVERKLDFYD